MPGAGAVKPVDTAAAHSKLVLVEGSEAEALDFSGAARWHGVVLVHGTPAAHFSTPSPGSVCSPELTQTLVLRRAERQLWRERLQRELAARIPASGAPVPIIGLPRPSCSVVIPTHRRPAQLAALLAALRALDPPAEEIIVVDSAPGECDCREQVLAAGARYVREDRRGASRARNAGIARACGELVAFADDDCMPAPDWLAAARENFADPHVALTTGPAFPWSQDTRPMVRMEQVASFTRGLRRREFDWTSLPIAHAGAVGASANMIARRALLCSVQEAFPVDLGPGTATESGDDSYLFCKILAAGHRVVYEPRQFVFHQHRAAWGALHRALAGYGKGLTAMLTKSLVEDRELDAPLGAVWLLRQYLAVQGRRVAGAADGLDVRMAYDYLRGAIGGPRAWWRQSREDPQRTSSRAAEKFAALLPAGVLPVMPQGPDADTERADGIASGGIAPGADAATLAVVRVGLGGAIRGPLPRAAATLLFLGEELQPEPGLTAAHAALQRNAVGPLVAFGDIQAYASEPGFEASREVLLVHDRLRREFERLDASLSHGPTHWNVSLPAELVRHCQGHTQVEALLREALASEPAIVRALSACAWLPIGGRGGARSRGGADVLAASLERLRLRRLWLAFRARQQAAGFSESAQLVIDLDGEEVLDASRPFGEITVLLGGRRLCARRLDPDEELTVEQAVLRALDAEPAAWQELALRRRWARPASVGSLREVCVVLCGDWPGRDRDLPQFLAERDLEVHRVGDWVEIESVLARSSRDLIVCFAAAATPTEEWLNEVVIAFQAPRVGVVLGAAVAGPESRPPLTLYGPGDLPPIRARADLLAFRREAHRFSPRRLGRPADWRAYVAETAEHALRDGWLLARQDALAGGSSAARERLLRAARSGAASLALRALHRGRGSS